jgi:protein SCO1/2
MNKKFILVWGIVILITVVVITFLQLNQPYKFRGALIESPLPAPEIYLPSSNGGNFRLSDHQGRIMLIFFGYTSCPDVCPTTLSDLKLVQQLLQDQAALTQVVFITVDPERDTLERLSAYLSLFDPDSIGLTGSNQQLEQVWRDYGVFREVDTTSETATGYLVNHSSRLYLVDQEGNLRLTYAYGTEPEDIASDIAELLNQ